MFTLTVLLISGFLGIKTVFLRLLTVIKSPNERLRMYCSSMVEVICRYTLVYADQFISLCHQPANAWLSAK